MTTTEHTYESHAYTQAPDSLYARHLLQQLLDHPRYPSGGSNIDNAHQLNRILAEAQSAPPAGEA